MLLQQIQRGRLAATTTAEAIQEFAHVRGRRRDRTDAAELTQAYIDLLAPLLLIEEVHMREGMRLFERYPELGSFDAVLAAATLAASAEALVSSNRAFSRVQGLIHMDPATPAIEPFLRP